MKRYNRSSRNMDMIEHHAGTWVKYEDAIAQGVGQYKKGLEEEARCKHTVDRENLDQSDMSLPEIVNHLMGLADDEDLAQVIADAAKELRDRGNSVSLTYVKPSESFSNGSFNADDHTGCRVTLTRSTESK